MARKGWLDGEAETACLSDSAARDDGMDALRMSAVTYRIITGRDAGRKVVPLQTLPGDGCSRHHGVFAPNASLRAQLAPSGRSKRRATDAPEGATTDHRTPDERRRGMTWAQRLKRVFSIDVSPCIHCGGAVRIVASIEEPTAIDDTMRPRPRRATLGPLPGIGAKWPWTVRIGGLTVPKSPTRRSQPRSSQRWLK